MSDLDAPCVTQNRAHKQYAGCTTCHLMDIESELATVTKLAGDLAKAVKEMDEDLMISDALETALVAWEAYRGEK